MDNILFPEMKNSFPGKKWQILINQLFTQLNPVNNLSYFRNAFNQDNGT